MTTARRTLAEAVRSVTADLPLPLVESLAAVIEATGASGLGSVQLAIDAALPQVHYRTLALGLLEAWKTHAPDLAPQSVAFALTTAARAHEHARESHRLELVWTGPDVRTIPPRQTEQALLQVIDAATTTLIAVSFVAYRVPAVAAGLARAARRGVSVRLVLEDPDVSQGKIAFDALSALGEDVAARADVYVWPLDQRPTDASGRHGSLHAKCAAADGRHLLISSANLTDHAFHLNIELGLLVNGGELPARVERHWTALIERGTLRRVIS